MKTTKEQAYKKISKLVERFGEHVAEYKRIGYNEHQTRVDYINPFFKALGWDMDNEQGYAEAYREVIHEDKVKVGSSTKAPDYGFTLFGQRKFFVDAKKPAVDIKGDLAPAYQVRRYGWSAKVPVSIVTDFEEFSIYDCTKKPKPTDKASVARIKYITYDQYLDEFDFLWDVFAKENLPKGRFDKYVQSDTRRKGTATVDDEFLKSIEQWRTYLATTVALRNKSLDEDEINYAVQKIIDRIIFLRMCEDRGVEQYGELKKAAEKGDVYKKLFALYRRADDKYNSGLFDFKEDKITPALTVDDKALKTIIKELYYPTCEYEFSVMPADILGSVYERFLGKTIRLTKAHHAKIEEKPEVRKAGGVYYTPKYIVDYIVENTVGKLLKSGSVTPRQVEKIKICDPACGSGSFLIGAYQYLLDWHLQYYLQKPDRFAKPVRFKNSPLTPDGKLTTAEKKRILLNNIFGVDIDGQAVEVTKLNLLLKALEGETQASISRQMSFFQERVLPNLDRNIKCGNSLIGPDFYDDQLDLYPGQMKKINAFDWQEGFPEIMSPSGGGAGGGQGGFDAVIGNPPYVSIDGIEVKQREYLAKQYPKLVKRFDLFGLFIDKGVQLTKTKGLLSYIIPMQFLKNNAFAPLRHNIIKQCYIFEINAVGPKVFVGANNDTIIFGLSKKAARKSKTLIRISSTSAESMETKQEFTTSQVHFLKAKEYCFELISDEQRIIIDRIENVPSHVDKYFKVVQGIVSGLNEAFIFNNDEIPSFEPTLLKDFLFGSDFGSYTLRDYNHKILYLNKDIDLSKYLKVSTYLAPFKAKLSKRREVVRNLIPWYSLQWPRNRAYFEAPKIIFQKIRNQTLPKRLVGTFDETGLYVGDGVIFINSLSNNKMELKILLGILNSRLLNYYYRLKYLDINLKINYITSTPIPELSPKNSSFEAIVKLVDKLLKLNEQLQTTKLETQRRQIQRAIDHAEKKIDELVYALYGLSKKEIEIIEKT